MDVNAEVVIREFLQDLFEAVQEYHNAKVLQFAQLAQDRKYLRDVSNPFTLDPEYFRKYYRFTPEVALLLLNAVEPHILAARATTIPAHLQLLIVLRFLAKGAFQRGFGQDFFHPISQTIASRCVGQVIDAINALSEEFIAFPNNAQDRWHIQNRFQQTIRIPGVIGLIDCFVVKFKKPSENEEAFFHYRHGTAMNVQIIVDSDYIIRNVRICPGSNNDKFVWQFSEAKQYMEMLRQNRNILQEEGLFYLLGDSGYTLSPVLLTPVLRAPPGSREANYTLEHVKTRWRVEQTIGVLSATWKAINRSRKLYYSPEKVADIINACVILHNFRKLHGIADENYPMDNEEEYVEPIVNRYANNYAAGVAERNRLINVYY